eukprot:974669-Amphidinium_carterae.1
MCRPIPSALPGGVAADGTIKVVVCKSPQRFMEDAIAAQHPLDWTSPLPPELTSCIRDLCTYSFDE